MLEPTQHDDETELEEALARPCPPGTSNAVDLTKPPCEQSRFRSIDKIVVHYTVQIGNGTPQQLQVELPGDVTVFVSDHQHSPKIRAALLGSKERPCCGKPTEFKSCLHPRRTLRRCGPMSRRSAATTTRGSGSAGDQRSSERVS
jgi:hypothetical protein